jgi:type IV pilus assembly protein PilW
MMIGIVIGMVAVLVIYQVYEMSERYKRATTTSGDAQTTGLYAAFVLTREIGNAGSGLMVNHQTLGDCPPNPAPTSLRPLPVVITDSPDGNENFDSIVVTYGASTTIVTPALGLTKGANIVQSPLGFRAGDLVIAANPAGAGCYLRTITNVEALPPLAPDPLADGSVRLTHAKPERWPDMPGAIDSSYEVINLGPAAMATRVRFDVDPATNAFRSCNLFQDPDCAEVPPVPIAGNVVLFKAQYGVDANGDGVLDNWVPADGTTVNMDLGGARSFEPASVQSMPTNVLSRIKAVRIAIVVRSDEPDTDQRSEQKGEGLDRHIFAQCPPPVNECSDDIKIKVKLPPPDPNFAWRYRTYETVIPLRNTIWNNVL